MGGVLFAVYNPFSLPKLPERARERRVPAARGLPVGIMNSAAARLPSYQYVFSWIAQESRCIKIKTPIKYKLSLCELIPSPEDTIAHALKICKNVCELLFRSYLFISVHLACLPRAGRALRARHLISITVAGGQPSETRSVSAPMSQARRRRGCLPARTHTAQDGSSPQRGCEGGKREDRSAHWSQGLGREVGTEAGGSSQQQTPGAGGGGGGPMVGNTVPSRRENGAVSAVETSSMLSPRKREGGCVGFGGWTPVCFPQGKCKRSWNGHPRAPACASHPVLSRPVSCACPGAASAPPALPNPLVGDTEGGLCVRSACLGFCSWHGRPDVVVASL